MKMFVMTILCAASSWLLPRANYAQEPYFYYYFDEPMPLGETPDTLAVYDRAQGTSEPLRSLLEDADVRQSAIERHPVAGWFRVRLDTESAEPTAMPDLIERLSVHDFAGRYIFSPVFAEATPSLRTSVVRLPRSQRR